MRMIGGVVLGMLENGSARIVCNCFVLIGGAVGRTVCSSNAFMQNSHWLQHIVCISR